MRRLSLVALLALVVALAVAGLRGTTFSGPGDSAQAAANSVDLVALDMDPTAAPANTINAATDSDADTNPDTESTTLGSIESCISVAHPATFDIDLVVQGYPPPGSGHSLAAYDANITYPAGLQVNNSITGDVPILGKTLISADPQSGAYFVANDAPNYGAGAPLIGPNTHDVSVLDFAPLNPDEDIDGEEESDGHLTRWTMATNAGGPAFLAVTLATPTFFVSDDAGGIPVTTVQHGLVAVDTPCPEPADLEKVEAQIQPVYGCKTDDGTPPPPAGTGTPLVDFRDLDGDTIVDNPVVSGCVAGAPAPLNGDDDLDGEIDEDPKDGVDNDSDTLVDEDPFGFLVLDNDADAAFDEDGSAPADLDGSTTLDAVNAFGVNELQQPGVDDDGDTLIDEDGLDAHVSSQTWFNLKETYLNHGPAANPLGRVTVTLEPPPSVEVSFHCDAEAIAQNAGQDVDGDTIIDIPCAAPGDILLSGLGNPLIIKKQVPLPIGVPQNLVQQFDAHCTEASLHEVLVTDRVDIDPSDPSAAVGEGDDLFGNELQNIVEFSCIGQSDLKITDMSAGPLPLKDLDGDTTPEQPYIEIGTPVDFDVNKTIHNNGPYGPADAEVVKTASVTGIDWGPDSPATGVPANCTVTPPLDTEQRNNLDVTVDDSFAESFQINCGSSPYWEIDDDLDGDFDEDPLNGVNDDPANDALIDEDPSFEIALVVVTDSVKPKDPHVLDPDPTNNVPSVDNTLVGGGAADPYLLVGPFLVEEPFTPTSSVWTDEGLNPENPTVPPTLVGVADDDCAITLGCEMELAFSLPAGQALAFPIQFVPQSDLGGGDCDGDAVDDDGDTTADEDACGYTVANGNAIGDGTPVGAMNTTLGIAPPAPCGSFTPTLGGTLLDGDLPDPFDGTPGDDDSPDAVTALGNPLSWSTNIEGDPQFLAFNAGAGGGYAGAPVWARYLISPPPLGFPVNIVVFNLGPGPYTSAAGADLGASGYAHVAVIGDPKGPPSGVNSCTPITLNLTYQGETAAGLADLRVCQDINQDPLPIPAGSGITNVNLITRTDTGQQTVQLDTNTCAGDNDSSVDMDKDEHVGDENPADDIIHVSIPTTRTVDVLVTNGLVPSDLDVEMSSVSGPNCEVDLDPNGDYGPAIPPTNINGQYVDSLGPLSMAALDVIAPPGADGPMGANETRTVPVDYSIHCFVEGTWTDEVQFIANVANTAGLIDPDPLNNQAENHPDVTAQADADGDGVDTPGDNCPDDPNPDQTDTDGDGLGDVCDPDDDNDGVDDGVDECPLVPEDLDGIDDTDGCPEYDFEIFDVQKDDPIDVIVSVSQDFEITVTQKWDMPEEPPDPVVRDDLLLISQVGGCEARWIPEAGDAYIEDVIDGELYSQLEMFIDVTGTDQWTVARSYSLHCFEKSDHSVQLEIGKVPVLPIREQDPSNNVHKQLIDITAWERADLKIVGDPVVNAPASIDVSTDNLVTVDKVIHNNGPFGPVNATLTTNFSAPADCETRDVTGAPLNSIVSTYDLDVSVDQPVSEEFYIHCSEPSTHVFTIDECISVTDPEEQHVMEVKTSNDCKQSQFTVEAIATADVGIVDMDVTAATPQAVGVPFPVDVSETLHNNGPYGPVDVQLTYTPTGVPADCVLDPPGAQSEQVTLPVTTDVVVGASWTATCSEPSFHEFEVTNDIVIKDEHVVEGADTKPNSASDAVTVAVEKVVTKEICDLWIGLGASPATLTGAGLDCSDNDGAFGGGEGIALVEPDVMATLYSNDLDYSSEDVNITRTVDLADTGAGAQTCDVDPAQQVVQEAEPEGLSVAAADMEWDVTLPSATHLGEPTWCELQLDVDKQAKDEHVSGGDSASTAITLCGDTDGDTVADNCPANGDLDNCVDVPNPGQEDADGDGIGDACERPGVDIKYCLKFGPAPVNLSDTRGAYLWAICEIGNLDADPQSVTIDFGTSGLPNDGVDSDADTVDDCSQEDLTILPGQDNFLMDGLEQKFIVFRARLECHDPVTEQVIGLNVSVGLEGDPDDDRDGEVDEDSRDGVDDDGDSRDGEDPPDTPSDSHEQIREVIISAVPAP